MSSLVLDGSVTLGFLLEDEQFPAALTAFKKIEKGIRTYVPTHWWVETVNGLIMSERRKRISPIKVSETLHLLQSLPVLTDDETAVRCLRETPSVARQYALTIYDAAYLELAMRRGSILATADKALAKAALAVGVEILH